MSGYVYLFHAHVYTEEENFELVGFGGCFQFETKFPFHLEPSHILWFVISSSLKKTTRNKNPSSMKHVYFFFFLFIIIIIINSHPSVCEHFHHQHHHHTQEVGEFPFWSMCFCVFPMYFFEFHYHRHWKSIRLCVCRLSFLKKHHQFFFVDSFHLFFINLNSCVCVGMDHLIVVWMNWNQSTDYRIDRNPQNRPTEFTWSINCLSIQNNQTNKRNLSRHSFHVWNIRLFLPLIIIDSKKPWLRFWFVCLFERWNEICNLFSKKFIFFFNQSISRTESLSY